MPKDKKNGGSGRQEFVTKPFCDERFQRIWDKLDGIDGKVEEIRTSHKEEGHAYRNLLLTILGGVVVSLVTFYLSHLPP